MVYPVKNRKTGLTVDFFYLQRQVLAYLDKGYSPAEWDAEVNQTVLDIVNDGLHQYYYPPPLEEPYAIGVRDVHDWNFMRPLWNFSTSGGQRRYALPDDFERHIGNITYPETQSNYYIEIRFTSSPRLRRLEAKQDFTSHPVLAALEEEATLGDSPQGQVLVLHPTPDLTYNLVLQYQSLGRFIDKDHPHPMGGQTHGIGILHSCLAVAEIRKEGAPGPRWNRFMQTLAGNVVRDNRRQTNILGYMGDGSHRYFGRAEIRNQDQVYYNDVTVE